jgi:hypothetical protein
MEQGTAQKLAVASRQRNYCILNVRQIISRWSSSATYHGLRCLIVIRARDTMVPFEFTEGLESRW